MAKFRSRSVIEAKQWFPGSDFNFAKVYELEPDLAIVFETIYERWKTLKPGDYVMKYITSSGNIGVCAYEKSEFEKEWENIGG